MNSSSGADRSSIEGGSAVPTGPPVAADPMPGGRPGGPAPRRGRAEAFRHEYARRQTMRTNRAANVVLVALIVVGAYAIVTEHPGYLLSTLRSLESNPGSSSPVTVQFGTPSKSTVSCAAGGTAYTESIPWENSTETLATGQIDVRLYEVWDGDNIADPGVVANATTSSLCAGTPPDSSGLWYVVLVAPNGTNLVTYTEAGSWSSVTGGSSDLKIYDGSFLVVVSYDSLAETGRGLEIVGFAGTAPISGTVLL